MLMDSLDARVYTILSAGLIIHMVRVVSNAMRHRCNEGHYVYLILFYTSSNLPPLPNGIS